MNKEYSNSVLMFRMQAQTNEEGIRNAVLDIRNKFPNSVLGVALTALCSTDFFSNFNNNNFLRYLDPKVALEDAKLIFQFIFEQKERPSGVIMNTQFYLTVKKLGRLPLDKEVNNYYKDSYPESVWEELHNCKFSDLEESDFKPLLFQSARL